MPDTATISHRASLPLPKTVLVMDLEVAPDPEAQLMLNSRDGARNSSWALARIEVATVLIARSVKTGWRISDFLTLDANPNSEYSNCNEHVLLSEIDRLLCSIRPAATTKPARHQVPQPDTPPRIVSYNGNAFDLPIIRRRAMLHGLFDQRSLFEQPWADKFDMMLELSSSRRTKSATLKQAAAGLRIPATHQVRRGPRGPLSAQAAKCQVDVCATFLLHAHHLAAEVGDAEPRDMAWRALARFVGAKRKAPGHLAQFVDQAERMGWLDKTT